MDATAEATTVLIVEDHPMLADALHRLIDDAPDVAVAGVADNAEDAVRLAAESHPRVVLMDAHLPGMSGAQAAAAIRATEPHVAVLFLSGDDGESTLFNAVEAGAAGYLSKASRPDRILEAVRRVAAGEMLIPASVLARLIAANRSLADSAARRSHALAKFTDREREVLGLMGRGLENAAIATALSIEMTTARWHVQHILDKLGAHSKLEAVARAARLGMLDP
jgi:DNA-binding NarL/FixJ family response regulator